MSGVPSSSHSSSGVAGVSISGTAASGQVPVASSSAAGAWAYPPGYEIGYDQVTASLSSLTATTEGTAQAFITCGAHTFDGAAVFVDFFCPIATVPTASNLFVGLFESGTLIDRIAQATSPAGAQIALTLRGAIRITPSAASHSYVIAAWVGSTSGAPGLFAGAGGPGNLAPGFVRFTKV